jgi:hypothetical protein
VHPSPSTALIVAHVAAGALGLLAGPLAMAATHRGARHRAAGWAYQACCLVLCTSALLLVARDPGLWGFAVIAVLTQLAAAGAVLVRRLRRPGWLPLHVQLALGSYVSFVTAFVVQTAGGLWWVLPVAVGSAATSVVTARVAASTGRTAAPAGPGAAGARPSRHGVATRAG